MPLVSLFDSMKSYFCSIDLSVRRPSVWSASHVIVEKREKIEVCSSILSVMCESLSSLVVSPYEFKYTSLIGLLVDDDCDLWRMTSHHSAPKKFLCQVSLSAVLAATYMRHLVRHPFSALSVSTSSLIYVVRARDGTYWLLAHCCCASLFWSLSDTSILNCWVKSSQR